MTPPAREPTRQELAAVTLLAAQRALRQRALLEFAPAVQPSYECAPHIQYLAEHLEAVERREITRLLISMPPRHGKTALGSILFPAWYLGRHPDDRVIGVSYSAELINTFSRQARGLIMSDAYRDIFPRVAVSEEAYAVTQWDLVDPTRTLSSGRPAAWRGGYVAAGVGGAITGRGANCFPAGTMIATPAGPIPIERLAPGEGPGQPVWAYDHDTEQQVLRPIRAVRVSHREDFVVITTTRGRRLRVTPEHPIYTRERGYRAASLLRPGDTLVGAEVAPQYTLRHLRRGEGRARASVSRLLPGEAVIPYHGDMRLVSRRVSAQPVPARPEPAQRAHSALLFPALLKRPSRRQESAALHHMQQAGRQEDAQVLRGVPPAPARSTGGSSQAGSGVSNVQRALSREMAWRWPVRDPLLQVVRESGPLAGNEWPWQPALEEWRLAPTQAAACGKGLPLHTAADPGAGRVSVCRLRLRAHHPRAPHRRLAHEQRRLQPRDIVQQVPSQAACRASREAATDTVALVESLRSESAPVYDLDVADCHNFFANGLLVHNCLLLDDVVKDSEEANSRAIMDGKYEWWQTTASTRLQEDGVAVLTMTRWSENDLIGRLLDLMEHETGADQWTVVRLPAFAEEDDPLGRPAGAALWPSHYNEAYLENRRINSGSRAFNALYQQRPMAAEGETFKEGWWQLYDRVDANHATLVIQVWDTAYSRKSGADYSVCGTWALIEGEVYLLDLFRDRVEYPALKRRLVDLYETWYPSAVLVEKAASGQSLLQDMRGSGVPIIAVPADTDKVTRATAVTPYVESGLVHLPAHAPWLQDYLLELSAFPNGRHDDQVDVTSIALGRLLGGTAIDRRGRGYVYDPERPAAGDGQEDPWTDLVI